MSAGLELVLITGMSGSGKSVALRALEDAGYYCVDNLPPQLLDSFVALERQHGASKIGIAMDVRSAASLHTVPAQLRALREQGVAIMPIFLDASTDTLVRRFSETRRLHPLSRPDMSDQRRALVQAIELERELVGELRDHAHVIDSSMIRSTQLQLYIKELKMKRRSPTVAYCRIGERSSLTWFVLKYLLGFGNVRNYDGSWLEWGNCVRVPIAKGAEPGGVAAAAPTAAEA
jgi:RNase adaptor protein for sRNA GlmZ degradation